MQIRFKSGARRGETFAPGGDRVVLGRDNTCQVVLDDEKASRRHSAITEYPDGQIVVEDLGSANGTWVDGERLTGPRSVRSGAEVRIGATTFAVSRRRARRRGRRRAVATALTVAALAAVAVVAAVALGGGDDDSGSAPPKKTTTTTPARAPDMDRLTAATVLVSTTVDGNRTNVASGWVLDADKGLVVTNAHVLHLQRRTGAQRIVVKAGGRRRAARPVGVAPCEDLAVLKVGARGLEGLGLAPAGAVSHGDTVVAAGFPFSREAARNVVPTQARVIRAGGPAPGPNGSAVVPLPDVLQLAVALRPGNSGGPVVDSDTAVVGIVAVGNTGRERRTYAVSSGRARTVLADLSAGRSRGWLGVSMQPGRGGLGLTAVVSGSSADREGLGDRPWIVERVGNRRIRGNLTSWCAATAGGRRGAKARLTVREAIPARGGYVPAPGAKGRVLTLIYE